MKMLPEINKIQADRVKITYPLFLLKHKIKGNKTINLPSILYGKQ